MVFFFFKIPQKSKKNSISYLFTKNRCFRNLYLRKNIHNILVFSIFLPPNTRMFFLHYKLLIKKNIYINGKNK